MIPIAPAALSVLLAAQAAGATLHGTVLDADTGEPVGSAIVALSDLQVVVLTDARGRYSVPDVAAGPQHVDVSHIGYVPRGLHVFVPSGGFVELHIALDRNPIPLEEVRVRVPRREPPISASAAALTADRRASGTWLREDPMVAEPDALLSLVGGAVAARPETAGGLHVRGGAADQVTYSLDGLPVFSPYHSGGSFAAWDPDALESVELSSAFPRPGGGHALAGQIDARTLTPGDRLRTRGAFSVTQARVSVDGPLLGEVGFLVSAREPFPGLAQGRSEPAILRGEAGDRLAVLHAPLAGGSLRALAYRNRNALHASAFADGDAGAPETPDDAPRNAFGWTASTLGLSWTRTVGGGRLELAAWDAGGSARATWAALAGTDADAGALAVDSLASRRDDVGFRAALAWGDGRGSWLTGLRLNRSSTSYSVRRADPAGPGEPLSFSDRTPTATAFALHTRPLADRVELDAGVRAIFAGDDPYLAPQLRLRWSPGRTLDLQIAYARNYQFAQSLRNGQSVAGLIFPAQLFAGAGDDRLPVARGHQVSAVGRARLGDALTARVEAWARGARGLLLAAPATGAPFALDAFATGTASARGGSAELAWASARLSATASYGLERVRHRALGEAFVPDHSATHRVDLGTTAHITTTFTVRVASQIVAGRRGTDLAGAFEFESCNLLEFGCEFAGSPTRRAGPLGGTRLPAYARVDFGLRKHWDLRLGGRRGTIGAFASATNLFARENVLLVLRDSATGERSAVRLRPRAPLTVGVDWSF
ncbi:MAG: TonB-dependent receptor [Gemmatimonadota bacterium]